MPEPGRGPSAWKAIALAIAFLASGFLVALSLVGVVIRLRYPEATGAELLAGHTAELALLQAAVMLVVFGGLTWLFGIRRAGLDRVALGWAPVRPGVRGFGRGLLLGAVPAAMAMVLAVPAGGAAWLLDGAPVTSWVPTVLATGGVLLPAALAEEVIFRGVPLVLLASVLGRPAAVGATAALFAVVHFMNPGLTPLALVNIGLAGILLGVVFYLPGGLWSATGAHLGWNLTLAALAAPVSGVPFPMPTLDYRPGGPAWLTGGGFGPEGGLLASATLLAAVVVASRSVGKETVR